MWVARVLTVVLLAAAGMPAVGICTVEIQASVPRAGWSSESASSASRFAVGETGVLSVRILDDDGRTTAARVNVIGADHAYYEPSDNDLREFSLKRMGNRHDRGPARYYGSFFYSNGSFELELPVGTARVEVQKGYAYYRAVVHARVRPNDTARVDVRLQRVVNMPAEGWHSVDTHIHFDRRSAADPRFVQLIAAEDVEFGHSLSMNETRGVYAPVPQDQLHAQRQYGKESVQQFGRHTLVSGHEYRSATFGHATQVLIDDLVPAGGRETNVTYGPSLAEIYDQTLHRHGAMGHAHGGYDLEILPDVVLGKSDWVELLQMGFYRGIGLDEYYLTLNSGFRYPLAAASDYPYNRTLSDNMTFVMNGDDPTFDSITGALLRGEAFATSGPLLFLSVSSPSSSTSFGPGGQIEAASDTTFSVTVSARAVSSYLPMSRLEIVQDGEPIAAFGDESEQWQIEGTATLEVGESTWIAARCRGPQDVRAHTNPAWIIVDGMAPFDAAAARALASEVDEFQPENVSNETRHVLSEARRRAQDLAAAPRKVQPEMPIFPRDSARAAAADEYDRRHRANAASLLPPVNPRPEVRSASVSGRIVDISGEPLTGAAVSARGRGPRVETDRFGRYTLPNVNTDVPLFIRAEKDGFVTTNTSYLNPLAEEGPPDIVLLQYGEARRRFQEWAGRAGEVEPEHFSTRPIILLGATGTDGDPVSGVRVVPSPDATVIGYYDGRGGFEASATEASAGAMQAIGSHFIDFRDSPDSDDREEPNLILSAPPLDLDVVLPLFAGQATYAVVPADD